MKKFFISIIVLSLMTGCTREVQTLPVNTPTVSGTTVPDSIPVLSNKTNVKPPANLIFDTPETVEIYDYITIENFVKKSNVEILNGDRLLDTSEMGEHEVYINCRYSDGEFQQKVTYTVADTTPPTLFNMGNSPYVTRGTEFDLKKLVGYGDNFDPVPTLTYDGEVNTEEIGNYPITVHVTDSSGNETSWNMTVVVLSETPSYEFNGEWTPDYSDGTPFTEFIETYSGDNTKFGIDVSTWQGDIDFNAVKNAGCDFVIIRMGHFYDEIKQDDWYTENIRKAREAGLEVGIYFYTTLHSAESVKELAEYINETLDGQELDFPIAFDWEEFTNFQEFNISLHELNELFNLFCAEMESYGYSAMLYSSKNFLLNSWTNNYNEPVWLAHFTDETDYTGDYFMWQASSTGLIDGIDGYIDMNILYTDRFEETKK
ncbi:MAG: glycoside hydrolase family 25 [Ruminococcus sp.]|nr:glycoside hydrolase family 25 [Ruminococcus sp.]